MGADGIHGKGKYANTVVVGKFLGAQMSAVAVAAPLGLIDHLGDGSVFTQYPNRTVVIAGDTNFTVTTTGTLPDGMTFDTASAQVYGIPANSGVFTFHVEATSSNNPVRAKTYLFTIAAAGVVLPPHSSVDTIASPLNAGTTTGDGVYTNDATATVTATPNAGYAFVNWTENGVVASPSPAYTFTNSLNQSLVANFGPQLQCAPWQSQGISLAWITNVSGYRLQQNGSLGTTNWVNLTNAAGVAGTNWQVNLPATGGARFFRLVTP